VVVQKDQNATGDAATFNMRENTVTLVGNVVVTRGTDVLRGQRLVVDLTSGVSKMDQGRVEGLFKSGSQSPPDPRAAAEKSNTADKGNSSEKSNAADKGNPPEKSNTADKR
jgi:lipopolysaccharide export system protein LptA